MGWHYDARSGTYWQTLDLPPLTAEQRRVMFSPQAQIAATLRYIRGRYGRGYSDWPGGDDLAGGGGRDPGPAVRGS